MMNFELLKISNFSQFHIFGSDNLIDDFFLPDLLLLLILHFVMVFDRWQLLVEVYINF
jgi:hypothetical protein